jgi:hypothetical protein
VSFRLSSSVLVGIVSCASVAALVIACGDDSSSAFDDGSSSGSEKEFGDASFGSSGGEQPDADPYANDPPPPWCGPGGDPAPPPPTGTLECPDDKNKPGCGCTKAGEKAKCWTGLRKHRELGICKDGETTCLQTNETALEWGPCVGEVLPKPGATKGAEACGCFSAGQWKIANLSPCTTKFTSGATTTYTAISTLQTGQCPNITAAPTTAPTEDWSTDTLKVDCAGHFKLCLKIRQGNFTAPSANDCVLGEVCTEADYKEANVEQAWPNLKGWIGADKACAEKWANVPETQSAGYVEMIVKGQSVRCDAIDDGNGGDLVFNRVQYCPRSCQANPNTPECASCNLSGQGEF